MGKLSIIQMLTQNGLFYLTEHADDEAQIDNFDIYDIENGILNGKVRKTWPKEGKLEIIGQALDGRSIGIVCRLTAGKMPRGRPLVAAFAQPAPRPVSTSGRRRRGPRRNFGR